MTVDALSIRSFSAELEKQAVSGALAYRVLSARAAQGARVAPGLLQHAAQTTGAAQASPALRRLTLNAGIDARAAQRAQGMAATKAPLLGRVQRAEALGAAQFDTSQPLRRAEQAHAYSERALNTLTEGSGSVVDPQGLTASIRAQRGALPVDNSRLRTEGTAVRSPLRRRRVAAARTWERPASGGAVSAYASAFRPEAPIAWGRPGAKFVRRSPA